jgi:hypothetical protein
LTEEKLSSAAAVDMLQLRLIAASQDVSCYNFHTCALTTILHMAFNIPLLKPGAGERAEESRCGA